MKSPAVFCLAALLSFTWAGCNRSDQADDSSEMAEELNKESFDNKEDEKDAEFVVEAVANNLAEIKLAQLALRKSNDVHIKEIAKTMEKDHDGTLRELKGLANKKGIAIPLEEDDEVKKEAADLETETQADFNKKWLTELEDHHKEIIRDFEVRWKDTKDEDLKSWINSALPDLRAHLDMLASYKDQVK